MINELFVQLKSIEHIAYRSLCLLTLWVKLKLRLNIKIISIQK